MDAMTLLWELLREDGDSPAPPTQKAEVAPVNYKAKSKNKKTLTSYPVCPLPFPILLITANLFYPLVDAVTVPEPCCNSPIEVTGPLVKLETC